MASSQGHLTFTLQRYEGNLPMKIQNSDIPHTSFPSLAPSSTCIPYPCCLSWLLHTIPYLHTMLPRAGYMLVLPKNHGLQNAQNNHSCVTSTDKMTECYKGSLYPGFTTTRFCSSLHTKKLGNKLSIISKR